MTLNTNVRDEEKTSNDNLPVNGTQEESLTDDIIGVTQYAAETRKAKDFLPWHKPRKQFVRNAQWCEQIKKMINEALPENNILKYLGLPGDDLLDLRYFHQEICEPKNLQLKYLGFNSGANPSSDQRAELNISLDEVNKLKLIDPTSDVIGDDICQIANTESIAWNRSRKMGPFDIINIDLCDGFGKQPPDQFKETHYNTLVQLMALQARRPNPWLLFLTTRTGSDHIDDVIYMRLKSLYGTNLDNCPSFQESSATKFAIKDVNSLEQVSTTQKGVSDIFLISLCKWIASILVGQNPPAKLEVKSVIGYKVEPAAEHEDLVSIAIRIEPTFLVGNDKIGLANQAQPGPDECSMALQALNRVSNQRNADKILNSDPKLMDEMIAMSSSLLEEARYDIGGYAGWAKSATAP